MCKFTGVKNASPKSWNIVEAHHIYIHTYTHTCVNICAYNRCANEWQAAGAAAGSQGPTITPLLQLVHVKHCNFFDVKYKRAGVSVCIYVYGVCGGRGGHKPQNLIHATVAMQPKVTTTPLHGFSSSSLPSFLPPSLPSFPRKGWGGGGHARRFDTVLYT